MDHLTVGQHYIKMGLEEFYDGTDHYWYANKSAPDPKPQNWYGEMDVRQACQAVFGTPDIRREWVAITLANASRFAALDQVEHYRNLNPWRLVVYAVRRCLPGDGLPVFLFNPDQFEVLMVTSSGGVIRVWPMVEGGWDEAAAREKSDR